MPRVVATLWLIGKKVLIIICKIKQTDQLITRGLPDILLQLAKWYEMPVKL
jgi:hypothetical protein